MKDGKQNTNYSSFSRDDELIYVWQYCMAQRNYSCVSLYHILVARGFTTNQLLPPTTEAQPPVITKLLDEALSLMSVDKYI